MATEAVQQFLSGWAVAGFCPAFGGAVPEGIAGGEVGASVCEEFDDVQPVALGGQVQRRDADAVAWAAERADVVDVR
ncbi:hypothetical protein A4R44_04336 [Amycolatopsis sp. M39]|nr:hypothetical protein A4R44_04336 [Amycolatopsis sp. M39]